MDGLASARRSRPVEVGLTNWDRSEIVSGVALGDEVVATLNDKGLEDGVTVQVGADAPAQK